MPFVARLLHKWLRNAAWLFAGFGLGHGLGLKHFKKIPKRKLPAYS